MADIDIQDDVSLYANLFGFLGAPLSSDATGGEADVVSTLADRFFKEVCGAGEPSAKIAEKGKPINSRQRRNAERDHGSDLVAQFYSEETFVEKTSRVVKRAANFLRVSRAMTRRWISLVPS